MKNFKNSHCRLPDSLTAILKNSELVIHTESHRKKVKNLSSKKTSPGKETQQLLSFQIDEINRLKREKSSLEGKVMDLESQVKRLSALPVGLKGKEKSVTKLRSSVKKGRGSSSKKKMSVSSRSTPKIRAESMFGEQGLLSTRHQTSRTHVSLPMSIRNSQSGLYPSTLHEILVKTENILAGWERKLSRGCKLMN